MNTGEAAGSWREAVGSAQPIRSRESQGTEQNQDLNRGFRDDDYGDQMQQQQYDDEEPYYEQDESGQSHTAGDGE